MSGASCDAIEESQVSISSSANGLGQPGQTQDNCLEKSTGTSAALVLRLESHIATEDEREMIDGYVIVAKSENEVEAHRISNNYMFGMKKWKSHVTQRPLSERSEAVKKLYEDPKQIKFITESTLSFGNILYCVLFGWWLALVYLIVAFFMLLTVVGLPYAKFCWMLSEYFFWPFGKFVQEHATYTTISVRYSGVSDEDEESLSTSSDETTPLTGSSTASSYSMRKTSNYWKRPLTYVWCILGAPILLIVHSVVALIAWLLIFFIPVAKVNTTAIKKILFMPPEKIKIDSLSMNSESERNQYEVVLCTYEAVNKYYYKYTVDGINVIMFNLSIFVIITLLMGYIDKSNQVASSITKFALSLMSIIPLAYYIGMAITSISAQSNFAVGAVLNATFGSIVEITLYVSAFIAAERGAGKSQSCYPLLVKSALTGTLLVTMLLIPGLCMMIGGIKYREQHFNRKSVGVSSSLLFVSVAGAFAPTLFAKIYGTLMCNCYTTEVNSTMTNTTQKLWVCEDCSDILNDISEDSLYQEKILPLIYICISLLPLAYIAGLLFTLKTHTYIYQPDQTSIVSSNSFSTGIRPEPSHHHNIAHWGRIKGVAVLLVSTIIMCLCADLVTFNIQPVLEQSPLISEIFIGGLLLAIVPNIPEILNGIQFALHNNISLSIEVGCGVAVQVCLLQIPILVIINAIHDIGFVLIFTDLHLYSVLFGVLLMNYIFQDGKCDYFQGTALLAVYLIFMAMYFFAPAKKTQCI